MTETLAAAARDHDGPVSNGPTRPRSDLIVIALAGLAAIAAAFAGTHPAGWAPADLVFTMALAATLTLAASRARPWTWAVVVAPGLVLAGGWGFVVGVAALAVVAVAVLRPPPRSWQGALSVGLGVQLLLRLPSDHLGGGGAPLSALVAAAAMVPVVASWYGQASGTARRRTWLAVAAFGGFALVSTIGLGVAAVSARDGMQLGLRHAERGLSAAEFGDQEGAAQELDISTAGFTTARQRLTAPWAWPARAVPVLGHYAATGQLAAEAGHDVAASAADAARQVPYDQLSPKDGHVDLDLVRSIGAPVDAAATQLEQSAARVDALDTTWLVPILTHRMDGLRDDLRKTVPEARRAADAVKLAPALLGGTAPRHYLILFANPAEARSQGGFVGAYGELTAAGGTLDFTRSGRAADLHIPAGALPPAEPGGFEDRYSSLQPAGYLGNVTASPDFDAVAVEAARLYGAALATHFDGVVYVDPYGLAALLKLTGPIRVEGLDDPLTEHDIAQFLLRDQYTTFGERSERFDYLAEASQATFHALTNAKLPEPRRAFAALYPAVASGRLRFVSFDPAEADFFGQIGLTGAFPSADGGDLVSVRSSNISPNKTDTFVQRTLHYEATVDPTTGSVDAVLTVTLANSAPLDLPSYVLSNRDIALGVRGGRPFGSNSTMLTLFSPLLLQDAEVAGTPVAVDSQLDAGVHSYAAIATVDAGQSVDITFHLHGQLDPGHGYQLTLVHQPTANDDQVTVVVHGAGSGVEEPAFPLTEDTTLRFGR